MASKADKITVNCPFMDKRTKLLPCQKEMVIHHHNKGFSQRALAKLFNVSRRTIQFILDPKKKEENLKRREERGGTMAYYDVDKHREYMRTHRGNKTEILKLKK